MRLRIRGVGFSYGSVDVLKGITFSVGEGEVLGIIGPNGSGKTTLLRCINMALRPKTGAVLIKDVDSRDMDRREIAQNVGIVPQNTTIQFPFTAFDVVLMGRTPHLGRLAGEGQEDLKIARKAMRTTSTLHLADRAIDEISGGERQRIIIARALTQEPRILLLDEPTLNLDLNHQFEIMELVRELARDTGLLVVLVSHDLNLSSRYCDRLILLDSGRIHSTGRPQDVITEENIRDVYHVHVEIDRNETTGSFHVVPVRATRPGAGPPGA